MGVGPAVVTEEATLASPGLLVWRRFRRERLAGRQFYVGFGAFDPGADSVVLTSVLTSASAVTR